MRLLFGIGRRSLKMFITFDKRHSNSGVLDFANQRAAGGFHEFVRQNENDDVRIFASFDNVGDRHHVGWELQRGSLVIWGPGKTHRHFRRKSTAIGKEETIQTRLTRLP